VGYPVVVKPLVAGLTYKSELGAVRLGLRSPEEVRAAVADLAPLADRFLVERMVDGVVAELLVGIGRDPRVGLHLTLGAGGVLVELLGDTVTLLLPAGRDEVLAALSSLRIWPLLTGFRGPGADVAAVVDAVLALTVCAGGVADRLVDLEVNPLLALREGAVAVDALVRLEEAG
jgi:acetyl-CoA synthetase